MSYTIIQVFTALFSCAAFIFLFSSEQSFENKLISGFLLFATCVQTWSANKNLFEKTNRITNAPQHNSSLLNQVQSIFQKTIRYYFFIVLIIVFSSGYYLGFNSQANYGQICNEIELGNFCWSNDKSEKDGIIFYLHESLTQYLYLYDPKEIDEIAVDLNKKIPKNKRTKESYIKCRFQQISSILKTDSKFNVKENIQRIDFTLKYKNNSIWIRGWRELTITNLLPRRIRDENPWNKFSLPSCGISGQPLNSK
jgi:hypothetical protein